MTRLSAALGPRLGRPAFALSALGVAAASRAIPAIGVERVAQHLVHHLGRADLGLYAHLIFAPLALALAPLQLWRGLRARRPGLHRWSGRLYAVSIAVAAAGSLALLPTLLSGASARAGFGLLAVL